jgi:hypothetical protein
MIKESLVYNGIFFAGGEGEIFRNRKMYFSINVQVVGDANINILNLVARWPGSANDATIFNSSCVRARFDAGHFPYCVLLGNVQNPQIVLISLQ